ncbi:MAG: HEAT repeat domain-containing protein, partial [Nitrospirales bacterium]
MTRSRLATSLVLVVAVVMATPSWAYREAFTPEQREKLQKIQTVFVDVIALTDTGAVDPGPMTQIVASRMEKMGYTVVTKSSDPYDAVLKVKCEQSKTWEGTTRFGSDFDLPDSPSRVWKGPACQFNYLLDGTKILWQKEVRTEFQDSIQAATEAGADNPGAYALRQLTERLRSHEYPLLLAAEWGHPDRLIAVLDDPGAHELQKLKAISLLGEMLAEEAVPRLKEALKDKDLAQQAAVALGNVGKE